jgi:WD40 repeat protein
VHTSGVYEPQAVDIGTHALIATADESDNTMRLWDPATGKITHFPTGHPNVVATCAFTLDDAALLATGGWDTAIRIWDPLTGQLGARSADTPAGSTHCAASPTAHGPA